MFKVIQVKIQEQVSYRKKISEFAWFDRSRDRLDRSRVVCRILIRPNCSSSQKRIRISDLLLLVYKGNPKHVFNKTFQREKSVPSLYLGFYTQKALSYLLPVLFLEESQDPILQKLLPSLVIKGANNLNLEGWSWSHKQESLCFFITSVSACIAKA